MADERRDVQAERGGEEDLQPGAARRADRDLGTRRRLLERVGDQLAEQSQSADGQRDRPGWYGSMRSLASMLGEPLHPNWNLNAYA